MKKKSWAILLAILSGIFIIGIAVFTIYSSNTCKDITALIEKEISRQYKEKKHIEIFASCDRYA